MKRSLYILTLGLLLGVLLTACQNDALSEDVGGGQPVVSGTDDCFLNLQIVNSSSNITRATTTDENAIYDGFLVFFVGDGETTAQLKSAVVIDQLINNPGFYSSIDIVQKLPINLRQYPTNGKIYVLALLNTTSTGFIVKNNMLYLNGVSLKDKTRAEIQSMKVNSVGSPDIHVGFYMASKPKGSESSTPGQTALQIYPAPGSQYLYDNQADITSSSGKLTLNVERAAARVSVTNGISTNQLLSNITLNNNGSRHPKIHRMSWAINNYNTESYAISGGTGQTFTLSTLGAYGYSGASDFAIYQQRSHQSGEAVYIAENTSSTETEVIVEVRLKDESNILLDDCYKYELGETTIFFTDAHHVIEYFKQGWADSFHNYFSHIGDKNAEEVFCQTKIVINNDASVSVTVSNPSFTGEGEQEELTSLSNTLSGTLTGYREGKMYYTYKVKTETSTNVWENKVLRNNAYNLTLVEETEGESPKKSISGIGRPTP